MVQQQIYKLKKKVDIRISSCVELTGASFVSLNSSIYWRLALSDLDRRLSILVILCKLQCSILVMKLSFGNTDQVSLDVHPGSVLARRNLLIRWRTIFHGSSSYRLCFDLSIRSFGKFSVVYL